MSTTDGDMGVLANHVPSIVQIIPGIISFISKNEKNTEKVENFFVSGGFATVNPDSSMQVSVLEAFGLDDFSQDRIKIGLENAQKLIEKTNGRDTLDRERSEGLLKLSIFQALRNALGATTM